MAASDEELMARAARGDLAAFGALFDRHQPRIYAFLCRFLGSAAGAEDVTQEVFWRIWRYRATYEPGAAFLTWAYSIARNAGLDEIRNASRRPGSLEELGAAEQEARPGLNGHRRPEEEVQVLALREAVRRALALLPEEQRLCLILREYEGRSHAEIAAILGCSEGAARVLSHRARKALRSRLEPLVESEESCV